MTLIELIIFSPYADENQVDSQRAKGNIPFNLINFKGKGENFSELILLIAFLFHSV